MGTESWSGSFQMAPFDLLAEASDAEGTECHVCEDSADRLVELSQDPRGENLVELGSAVFLCQRCFDLVISRDAQALSGRFTEGTPEEANRIVGRIIFGNVANAPVAH